MGIWTMADNGHEGRRRKRTKQKKCCVHQSLQLTTSERHLGVAWLIIPSEFLRQAPPSTGPPLPLSAIDAVQESFRQKQLRLRYYHRCRSRRCCCCLLRRRRRRRRHTRSYMSNLIYSVMGVVSCHDCPTASDEKIIHHY